MSIKYHLEKLNYFYQIAKSGSIKKAADIINITQPSLSKSIKKLEESINKPLLTRHSKGISLTHEGEILFTYCHSLFTQIDNLEVKLQHSNDPMAGNIKVGTYDSIAIYFWPKFLKKFLTKYSKLDFELTTGRSHQIQKKVEEGEINIGLIIEPKETINTEVIILTNDDFKLYATPNLKKKNLNKITSPFIYMPDAMAGKERLAHELNKTNDTSKINHFRTSSLESTKELIINGIGIGLLPRMVAQPFVDKNKIVPISPYNFTKEKIGVHKIGLVINKQILNVEITNVLVENIKRFYS